MDEIPQRTGLANIYRSAIDKWEKYLIFPLKNPSYYQVIGLMLSVVYLFKPTLIIQSVLVGTILILDWMDGAVARKYNLVIERGG